MVVAGYLINEMHIELSLDFNVTNVPLEEILFDLKVVHDLLTFHGADTIFELFDRVESLLHDLNVLG